MDEILLLLQFDSNM